MLVAVVLAVVGCIVFCLLWLKAVWQRNAWEDCFQHTAESMVDVEKNALLIREKLDKLKECLRAAEKQRDYAISALETEREKQVEFTRWKSGAVREFQAALTAFDNCAKERRFIPQLIDGKTWDMIPTVRYDALLAQMTKIKTTYYANGPYQQPPAEPGK